jgi:D-sedoheptulose 7-phosphate isomerase
MSELNAISSKQYPIDYFKRLSVALNDFDQSLVQDLADLLLNIWQQGQNAWICGNGGSAANAIHWANDFLYPIAKNRPFGVRLHALSVNPSIITCLANDIGYEQVFSRQLTTFGASGDLLIVLSGSGNSSNILEALKAARLLNIKSLAIVGFDGGEAKNLADSVIHIKTYDMQIAEDMQMAICHSLVQYLGAKD